MEMQLETFKELQDRIDEMDPTDPECAELQRTLRVCQEMAYAVAEGLIEVEEIEGEPHFFPTGALVEA